MIGEPVAEDRQQLQDAQLAEQLEALVDATTALAHRVLYYGSGLLCMIASSPFLGEASCTGNWWAGTGSRHHGPRSSLGVAIIGNPASPVPGEWIAPTA